jgi:hypothetical protein
LLKFSGFGYPNISVLWITPLSNQKLTLQNSSRSVEHQEFCRCSACWRYAVNPAVVIQWLTNWRSSAEILAEVIGLPNQLPELS